MRKPHNRLVALMPVAVAAVLAVAGVTLASDSVNSQPDSLTPPEGAAPPPPSAMPGAVAARLGVLRGPRAASDALPPGAGSSPNDLAFIDGSEALSRRVSGPGPRRWIVPGVNGICLAQESGATFSHACGATSSVASGKFVLVSEGSSTPGRMSISGVVPDGVDHVTVRDGDGARHDVPTSDNGFAIAVPSGAARISWTATDGTTGVNDIPAVSEPGSP
jgi:hypothetical protein